MIGGTIMKLSSWLTSSSSFISEWSGREEDENEEGDDDDDEILEELEFELILELGSEEIEELEVQLEFGSEEEEEGWRRI